MFACCAGDLHGLRSRLFAFVINFCPKVNLSRIRSTTASLGYFLLKLGKVENKHVPYLVKNLHKFRK